MPNDPQDTTGLPVNSAAPGGNAPVESGGAAAGSDAGASTVNQPAPGTTGASGVAAAAGETKEAPVEMGRDELVAEMAALQHKLNRAVAGYAQMQRTLEESQKRILELQRNSSGKVAELLPKTKEEMVAVLSDPTNRFHGLIKAIVHEEFQNIAPQVAGSAPSLPRDESAAFSDNLSRVSAVREIVQFANESGMNQTQVVEFLAEFGLQVGQDGKVVSLPFQWASSPGAAVKMAKDIIRGRMAPTMAKQAIQAAADAAARAADNQIKSQLPTGGPPAPGGTTPGGAADEESQRFLQWINASPDEALKMG